MVYVMVPVPEEHVEELMDGIMRMALRPSLTAWQPATMRQLVESSDATSQALIWALTRAATDDRRPTRAELAAVISSTLDEVSRVVDTINDRCSAASWPFLVFADEDEGGQLDGLYINRVAARLLVPLMPGGPAET